MKRILFLILLFFCLASCTYTFEDEAEKRLNIYLRETVADPDYLVENKSVLWSDDSLCIFEFNLRARNEQGGYELKKYQYSIVKSKQGTFECLRDYYKYTSFQYFLNGETRPQKVKEQYYKSAIGRGIVSGREVKD